jgi:hypothetical protein
VTGCYRLDLICDTDDELCENECYGSTVFAWWQ